MPTALILENEAVIALDLATELRNLGIDIVGFAKNTAHALEIVRRGTPDIAIVDVMLDGTEPGLSIAENLRAQGVKVLVVSGDADAREQQSGGFLTKPWTRDELTREIALLTSKPPEAA